MLGLHAIPTLTKAAMHHEQIRVVLEDVSERRLKAGSTRLTHGRDARTSQQVSIAQV